MQFEPINFPIFHHFVGDATVSVFLKVSSVISSITVLISRSFSSSLNVSLFVLILFLFHKCNLLAILAFLSLMFSYAACIFLFPMNFSLPNSSHFFLTCVFHARDFDHMSGDS